MRCIFLCCCLITSQLMAQNTSFIPDQLDVLQYRFNLNLSDSSDELQGIATIRLQLKKPASSITLDLSEKNSTGKGMLVSSVSWQQAAVKFSQSAGKLVLETPAGWPADSIADLQIVYRGIPADGLIISTNKYGHRTFFGDNWPNRAHQWLPCNDHPSDKATVIFRVTAPDHYQLISNGQLTERTNNGNGYTTTEYTESISIPTKVMVIGVADFAMGFAGMAGNVPVYSWLFPEDRQKGFYDYAQATEILPFFTENIAPYPFEKLANVQSKTIFGGMENAGCIFYFENSVNGTRKEEPLLVHEIAHQWFGNSATETSWNHLWLSEGFATYMTNLYLEKKYGADTLMALLKTQRKDVLEFYQVAPQRPVIDSLETSFMKLLNANSYQKAGWFLHMLRRKMGDEKFWLAIRQYYVRYAGKNASTKDFRQQCELAYQQPLDLFFAQWLQQSGQPNLQISFRNRPGKKLILTITQLQQNLYQFPLELSLVSSSTAVLQKLDITQKQTVITLPVGAPVTNIIADPMVNLMAAFTVKRVK
jgi:aminopeptidase N